MVQLLVRDKSSPICLRADFPFPVRGQGFSYFEITVLDTDDTNRIKMDSGHLPLTVGFCGEFCDQTMANIGWNVWSVGYHGDDGSVIEEASCGKHKAERKFGIGCTVGCGVNFCSEEYYFTLNGHVVGTSKLSLPIPKRTTYPLTAQTAQHKSKVVFRKMYPAISHSGSACKVQVNFEGNFQRRGARKGYMGAPLRRQRTGTVRADAEALRRILG